jgi:NTP pyrophosphatase (non-canonical NTP hydrolase)
MFDALRLANFIRAKEWNGDIPLDASYKATELGGEVGEALNVVKKLERERLGVRGSRDTVEHLAEELADIIICVDLLAMHYRIDLGRAVSAKFNKTSEKLGLDTRL